MDLDLNGYPDLLIGAYDSDAAILLRSRPIVGLVTSVAPEANLHKIDPLKKGCFKDVKSEYTWGGAAKAADDRPSTVESDIILVADKQGQLKKGHDHTVYIKENTRDIQSPIMFRLSYTLVQKEPRMPKRGSPLPNVDSFPILNQQEAAKVFKATFLKDCGENDICESELLVEAELGLPTSGDNKSSWQLVLGEHEEVLLKITAHNLRESAYEAQLFVSHPATLNYIGRLKTSDLPDRQPSCNPHNNTLVICSLGNPLKQDASMKVHLRFDPKPLGDEQASIQFTVFANTTSQDVGSGPGAPQDPLKLKAVVVRRAEISLQGLARPEQVFYGGQVRGESAMQYGDEIGSRVLHTYQVFNRGPWKVSRLEVHLEWPYQVANNKPQGKWLLYLDEKPVIEARNAIGECHMAPGQVNPLGLKYRPGVSDSLHDALENLALTTMLPSTPLLHNATMEEDLDGMKVRMKRDTEMVVKSETVSKDGRSYNVVNMVVTVAKVDLHQQRIAEPIPLWIIILAIVVGLILLILLTLLLWKLGFFKRRHPDPTLSGNLEKHVDY
ncbi:hypothetical protein LSTR_LSTR014253 [Laodelphax striatellus]|uniref:Uncharacterized protein n=1 Tax=Laodelphax striatellus TaxID=195883 RepID=A0A482WDT2_LAOST|nr:hypothetical protein LSTR_LSTR014253 [Laodelphax striatellus]